MTKPNPYLLRKIDLINQLRENFPNDAANGIDSYILDILADIEKGKFSPVLSNYDVQAYGGPERLKGLAAEVLLSLK